MKKFLFLLVLVPVISICQEKNGKSDKLSNNPIVKGWYADPEAMVFGDVYWIFPTYSAQYEDQVFLDAFSSKDLVNWKKHNKVIDTSSIKWAKQALWAPSIIEKKKSLLFIFFG